MKQSPIAVTIKAEIAADSVASAARAFQIILVLQEVGEILDMEPSQSIIETAAPLQHFRVDFLSHIPLEELKKRIQVISEVERVEVEPLKNAQVPQQVQEEKAPKASMSQEQQRETIDLPEGVDIQFEITAEELPIFVAEAEEQIQVLDEGLVRLEQESEDEELLQAVFRAAHTLKGAAGMIGHKRMVEVTHALESALDGLRKKQLEASSDLIDLCLEAVDAIRVLEEEIVKGKTNRVAVTSLVRRFESLKPAKEGESREQEQQLEGIITSLAVEGEGQPKALLIQADISPLSVASAARAFQIILALKDLGDIVAMQPSREHIDRAANVKRFSIYFIPQVSVDEIQAALSRIDEIDRLQITSVAEDTLASFAAVSDEAPRTIQAEPVSPAAVEQSTKNNVKAAEKMLEQTVRTSVERLDNLMNLVGELITDRNRLNQLRSDFELKFRGDEGVEQFSNTVTHIGRITDQLQSEVMRIRMQPVSSLFNKFPRLVRDLARKANKEINLIIHGEDTELDRTVIENISDPLIHLIRNSVDHGIEPAKDRVALGKPNIGTITLTARHEQGHIVIMVEDDGKGIDVEAVKAKAVSRGLITPTEANTLSKDEAIDLIFASGLSTAKTVTDISGRGVGMDIVRKNIEQLNGSIVVETWPQRGTQFQIILPLTLAIMPTLLVQVGAIKFAVPLVAVIQTLRIPVEEIKTVNQRPVIKLRGNVLSLVKLSELFNFPSYAVHPQHEYVVVVRWGKSQLGIIVDRLLGEQELVVKSISTLLGETPGIASAAILGDGKVSLILDIKGLFVLAGLHQHRR